MHMQSDFYGLWFKRPAASWIEALPLGNGRLGCMVYGGIQTETISINEETVWEGEIKDRSNPAALDKLKQIRAAIFAGKYEEAEKAGEDMLGIPPNLNSYQPLCHVNMRINHTGIFEDYTRRLNLEDAIHTVKYNLKGQTYTRETFVSAVDNLIVMRMAATGQEGLYLDISLGRFSQVETQICGNRIIMHGQCAPENKGVRFASILEIVTDKGQISRIDGGLRIKDTNEVEIRLAGATDYHKGDPVEKCRAFLERACGKPYEELKKDHVQDYRALSKRQTFRMGNPRMDVPTDELAGLAKSEKYSGAFFALWYNYLRYQIIATSRPGCLPSNLQGIWNDNMNAPWNSDYHPNVNMQINYWPVEGYGLPECVQPLVDWLEHVARHGEKTAKAHYAASGWVLHHISDIFFCTEPMDGPWGIWPFGGVWLCRNLYEHYLYTQDKTFLKERALPLIRGAVMFMLDFLIECPKGLPGEGYLVTCPSHSPENRFVTNDGQVSWLTYAAAMDMEITYDLFTIYLNSLDTLNLDEPLSQKVKQARERLVPLRISKRNGCLMEWIEDYEETEPGHRHVSHLYALYPGTQISSQNPDLLRACEKTLARRLSHHYDAQGWCCGWLASLFARLHKGQDALNMLERIAHGLTLPNLMVNAHGHPQVGDAQAVAAAIQEMLAQSHEAFIDLLPALPYSWDSGTMEGFYVRGGHILSMYWDNGSLTGATVVSGQNGVIRIRSPLTRALDSNGAMVACARDGMLEISAQKGAAYKLCNG